MARIRTGGGDKDFPVRLQCKGADNVAVCSECCNDFPIDTKFLIDAAIGVDTKQCNVPVKGVPGCKDFSIWLYCNPTKAIAVVERRKKRGHGVR